MRKQALAMLVVMALNNGLVAMECKPKTELTISSEESFMIPYEASRYHPEALILHKYMRWAEKNYELYGKEHGVSIETLRGDNFQPREFWTQPFEEILHILYPLITKYHLFHIASFDTDEICFSKDKYCYEFINEVPHTCPEMIEYFLEDDAYDEITKWMKKRGLKPIDWDDYQESLHNYYGAKEPLKIRDPNARKLPLYEYFLPCFL